MGELYYSHLYDENTEGYIHIIKISENKKVKVYPTEINNVREIIEEIEDKNDIYITPNTTFIPKRKISYIRQFRALFMDLDNLKYEKPEIVYMIWTLYHEGKIPEPTMVVDSGRGLHVYWKIEHAPVQAWHTWQELQDYLYYQLKDLGADKKATDGVRPLRVPSTINSKNNALCKVLHSNDDLIYSMYNLREKYLDYKQKETQIKFHETNTNVNNKIIPNRFFNSYSLHMSRVDDVETICKLRNYDMKGCRNAILHCYAYWKGVTIRDDECLREDVYSLNSAFVEPMKCTEVDAILRCIPKAIDKFIAYEQGLRSGEVKRVSKGMRDKGGYWYKNETLIEIFSITREEQQHLKTIIDSKEKYRRCADDKKAKQKAKRRNEHGLTPKQQELQEIKIKILELKETGLSNRKIAEKLGCSEGKIRKILQK